MKEENEIKPVPCSKINKGKKCGRLPTIIHPAPGLYYAVCRCPAHNFNGGKYQYLGMTREAAIRRWNDFHKLGIDHHEEDIKKLQKIFDLTKEQAYEYKTRNPDTNQYHKDSRGRMRPKHYTPHNRGKATTD